MSYPSDTEKQLLTKFRSRVFDILKPGEDRSDQFLVKWIRAQDGNLEKAELMIRKSFDWRQLNCVDSVLSSHFDSFFLQNYSFNAEGVDTLGHPILVLSCGSWDMTKIIQENKEEEFIFYTIQILELSMQKIRDQNQARGRKPWEFQNTQITAIVDWAGYSYNQLANFKGVQLFLRFVSLFDPNYPNTLYKAFYINCPPIFSKLFTMIKPVLSKGTVDKIKVYGNKEEWEKKVTRLIHPNQISQLLCN